jgi:hypothetical protein
MLKMKSDLEKQASDNHNWSTRDILTSKSDILRQNVENTLAIQTEALKNKDSLSKQMMECCCEIKDKIITTDKDRVRDFLVEQRIENSILRHKSPYRDRSPRRNRSRSPTRSIIYNEPRYYNDANRGEGRDYRRGGGDEYNENPRRN